MNRNQLHPRTVGLNLKEKHAAKQMRFVALDWLAQKFPDAFDNRIQVRPLKIGIMKDLLTYADEALAHGISRSKLREAVVLYTRRIDYLTALKAREMRIDLFGVFTESVTEAEAECAAQKIKIRVEKATKHAHQLNKGVKTNKANLAARESFPAKFSPKPALPSVSKTKAGPSITIKRKFQAPSAEAATIGKLKEKLNIS